MFPVSYVLKYSTPLFSDMILTHPSKGKSPLNVFLFNRSLTIEMFLTNPTKLKTKEDLVTDRVDMTIDAIPE